MHLLEAVIVRDTSFLYTVLSDDILTSFGGNGGTGEFKEYWKPENKESDLWKVLGRVVSGGGIYNDDSFSAPYYSAAFPSGDIEPFDLGVIIGSNVAVYKNADAGSEVIATLDYDIIETPIHYPSLKTGGNSKPEFVDIRLKDGRTGFVHRRYVGRPVGYRAHFKNGKGNGC